ncbi:hypothetical protein WJU23_16870 [Prosthecobacter sp. SYSU 5D2]|uniref:hypothetical protein n=1 Tax=Prosthecobacter sp. SYSU 5D2 TaxID=3134134 RepID=UPI0031FEAC11
MAEEEIPDDNQPVPEPEETLDESQEMQINRMAGCARLGKWLVYAALVILALIAISRYMKGGF